MIATIIGIIPRKKIPAKKIPSYLIYEIWDGKPIYYKGYEDVVNGIKTKEEIMGGSALQSFIGVQFKTSHPLKLPKFYLAKYVYKFVKTNKLIFYLKLIAIII